MHNSEQMSRFIERVPRLTANVRVFDPLRKVAGVILVLLLMGVICSSLSASTTEPTHPADNPTMSTGITLAVLGLSNETRDPSKSFWSVTAYRLLGNQLGEVGALSVKPTTSYALKQLSLKPGGRVDASMARKFGVLVGALAGLQG